MARLLLAALFAVVGHSPARTRIDRRADLIVRDAEQAEADYGVPAGVLLVVGFLETHLGTDSGEGGNWGAPVSRIRRHTAGTSDHAARALARSFAVCGTWYGAVHRFRCGQCHCPHLVGYEAPYAIHLVSRVYQRAGVELPERLLTRH